MRYNLTTPCGLCPFRNDSKRLRVSPERLLEMAAGEFCCHQTTEVNDDGEYEPTPESSHCAGALIFLENLEQPHHMMRICERLGLYDRTKLNMEAPVFASVEEVEEAEE